MTINDVLMMSCSKCIRMDRKVTMEVPHLGPKYINFRDW
jgi:hypothetical protein